MIMKKIRRCLAITTTKMRGLNIGSKSLVYKPMQIDNPKGIRLGNNVTVFDNSWLMGAHDSKEGLVIDDGTVIGHFAHIIAYKNVYIGKNVLCADKVFISDSTHNYENISLAILEQEISQIKDVVVGDGSWLGENVCVCGASIGMHCVIGANSVVTDDIPDYCVAVGSPAKVIKKYDLEIGKWIKVES